MPMAVTTRLFYTLILDVLKYLFETKFNKSIPEINNQTQSYPP